MLRYINKIHLRSIGTENIRAFSTSFQNSNKSKSPQPESELYFGKFTKKEYDDAANYINTHITRLEKEIKGDVNIRENIGSMPIIPAMLSGLKQIRVDDLSNLLSETIKTTGPLPLLAFMRQCLTHPQFGYYTTRDPLDTTSGDFITSPEISSMFGEMIGIWLFSTWVKQNKPQKFNVIEFGPGRGTLMYDCLKTFNKFNKNLITGENIEIIMIEASPVLRKEQWKLLCEGNDFSTNEDGFNVSLTQWGNKIKWVDTETDVVKQENVANYVLAHEFFDALPIKGFQKTEDGWRELLVEHTPSVVNTQPTLPEGTPGPQTKANDMLNTEFHLTMSPKETPSSILPDLNPRFKDLPVDSRIEICPDAELYVLKMAQLLDNQQATGSVLIIDYGLSEGIPDNTLRGIYKHKFVSPFIKPGEVDLSVDVDFTSLKDISLKTCKSFGPVDQGDWLHQLGIGYRTDQLIKANEGNMEAQEKIYNAYTRLTSKDEKSMGKIYKFLCLTPYESESPVGFGGSV